MGGWWVGGIGWQHSEPSHNVRGFLLLSIPLELLSTNIFHFLRKLLSPGPSLRVVGGGWWLPPSRALCVKMDRERKISFFQFSHSTQLSQAQGADSNEKRKIPKQETHKMEIEKHYTSNCEKIVKCGWENTTHSATQPASFSFHLILRFSLARW